MSTERRVMFLARHLDSGGVTTHMMALAQGLKARGWEVGVASAGLAGDHERGPEWFEAAGVPHFDVPFGGPATGPRLVKSAFASAMAFDKAVRQFRPSVLHVHWRSTSPFAALESSLRGMPFVSTLHLDGIPSTSVFRAGSRWGSRVIAISTETWDYLVTNFGVPESRLRLVFNGVDPDVFRPATAAESRGARERFDLRPDAPVVSLIGRLRPVKGHHILLEAARSLESSLPDLQLLFAGEGPEREDLERQAGSLGLSDRTRFVGYADSRSVLWASDLFVLPSYQEGFPVAVVESMMCGVPVVRTPAAGARDQVIDGVTGFIVPFDDPLVTASRMQQILVDRDLGRRMADSSRRTAVERFALAGMIDAIEGVYLEVDGSSKEVRYGAGERPLHQRGPESRASESLSSRIRL